MEAGVGHDPSDEAGKVEVDLVHLRGGAGGLAKLGGDSSRADPALRRDMAAAVK